jgi:ribosomal protein S18 acetylase RimI-like enzyme
LDERGNAIGMAYGYKGGRGQWWTDQVARKLSPQSQGHWLASHYEVVEVAVHPKAQRRGIGGVLVLQLLASRPESIALLSTRTDAEAHRLYRRIGFEALTEIQFGENQPWYYIMGRRDR